MDSIARLIKNLFIQNDICVRMDVYMEYIDPRRDKIHFFGGCLVAEQVLRQPRRFRPFAPRG